MQRNDIAEWAHKMDQLVLDARNLGSMTVDEGATLLVYAERITDIANRQTVTAQILVPPPLHASP